MTTAHANGKVILVGEHAVVYGQPAIAIPVSEVGVSVEIVACDHSSTVEAPGIGLSSALSDLEATHPIRAAIDGFSLAAGSLGLSNYKIYIHSTIPVASGLGSGAAVSIALLKALNLHFKSNLSIEQINQLAFNVEKIHHGTPSGIDNSVIAFGKPVFYIKGEPIETFFVQRQVNLVIGDTGIPAPTKTAVLDVRKLVEEKPATFQPLINEIGELVRSARISLEAGELDQLGMLMQKDHSLLRQLGVSSPELEILITAAMEAGALGAKLSGGGRGGNMIALVKSEFEIQDISKALLDAGAKAIYHTRITPP